MYPVTERIAREIAALQVEMGVMRLPFYLVSDAEWDQIAIEHFNFIERNPMYCCGVPLRKISEMKH